MADVAQATWLRLLEHIHRFESPDRVGSWLASTARHECLRRIAANKKMALTDDEVRITKAALEPGVAERMLAAERVHVVREVLSSLPRKWQELLELLMADPRAS